MKIVGFGAQWTPAVTSESGMREKVAVQRVAGVQSDRVREIDPPNVVPVLVTVAPQNDL
jgi:hypothetical protein